MDHDEKVREMEYLRIPSLEFNKHGSKSRGVYLQWLDEAIRKAKGRADYFTMRALQEARKAFTDEFYPK
jgi:hypothetical protein